MGVLGDNGSAGAGEGSGAGSAGSQSVGQSGAASGGQGAGGGAAQGAGAGAAGGERTSWIDTLPDDLKGHTGLQQFSDVTNLAKSWVHAQSVIGKKGVFPPGEKASDEEYSRFYKELGLPEIDKYDVKGPDGMPLDDNFMKSFRETAHKSGVMPKQAKALLDWYLGAEKSAVEARQTQFQTKIQEGLTKLKSEWGEGYDKQMALGDMALQELGGDELIQHVVKTGLAKDPTFIKLMAKVGGILGEDKLRGEDSRRFGGQTTEQLQREIGLLFAKPEYTDSSHAGHQRAVQDMAGLYKKLHG